MDPNNSIKSPAGLLNKMQRRVQRMRSSLGSIVSALPAHVLAPKRQDAQLPETSDKRRHPRVTLRNTTVQVTDGCLYATAMLGNISPTGICLCDLPEQLYKNAGKLTVFSSDNPGLPVLQIEPRWQKTGWHGKTIGAAIVNTTDAWRLFFVHTAGEVSL
ncbi:MAG: hypothetical protein PHI97_05180 [Desulfobulbus sp.]|nr:hypothetical protein [Desulfobulbus sp.]